MKSERNTNIDMLKCLLMMGVMLIHTIEHGLGFSSELMEGSYVWHAGSLTEFFLICFSSVAVNCYFLISGYYGIKYSRKKLFGFVALMFFYASLTWIVGISIGVEQFSIMSVVRGVMLGWRSYWFMVVYLVIMLFSEYINQFLDNLNANQFKKLIMIWFFINTVLGFVLHSNEYGSALSVLPMFFLYCIGYYIHKYNVTEKIQKNTTAIALSYPFAIIVNMCISLMLFRLNIQSRSYSVAIDYCNPLIVIGAVSLFVSILQMKKKTWEGWSAIAPHTLSVYLLTETVIARKWVYAYLDGVISATGSLGIVFYSIGLYVLAVFIDFLRSVVVKSLRRIAN